MASENNLLDTAWQSIWKNRAGLDVNVAPTERRPLDYSANENIACVFPLAAVVDNQAHGIRELSSPLSDG